jgi:hypothetical protein
VWPPLLAPTAKLSQEASSHEVTITQTATESRIETTAGVTPAPPVTVALDPAALFKLFELCEDMKQQNEELKQQLREQQTVLATLSEKTIVTEKTNEKQSHASVEKSKCRPNRKDTKPSAKPTTAKPKLAERKCASAKILENPSALPTISRKVGKILTPIRKLTAASVEPETRLDRVGIKTDAAAPTASPLPTTALPSRLVPPRMIPRLRKTESVATRLTNSSPGKAALVGPVDVAEVPHPRCERGVDTASPSTSATAPPTENASTLNPDRVLLPHLGKPLIHEQVPRLEQSPPIDQLKKRPRPPSPLPPIATRVSSLHFETDNCLDAACSTRSTLMTRLRTSIASRHDVDPFNLEACSSSASVLVGLSTMVPCAGVDQ